MRNESQHIVWSSICLSCRMIGIILPKTNLLATSSFLGLLSIEPCRLTIVSERGKPSDCKDVCDGHHIPKAAWLIGHLHSFFFCRCPVQVYLVFAFTVLFVVFACNWPSKIPKHNTYLRPSWAYSWSNWPTAGSVCCNFRCPIMHWNTPGRLGAKNVCFEFLIS